MSQYNWAASPSYGNVGSYMASGFPFMTGSADIDNGVEDKIVFPFVTKSITVISRGAPDLRIHFASKTDPTVYSGLHYVTLTETKDSITMNVRVKEMYISNADADNGSYEVFAELTGIDTNSAPAMSGSGVSG